MSLREAVQLEINKLRSEDRETCINLAQDIANRLHDAGFPIGPLALTLVGAVLEKELGDLDEILRTVLDDRFKEVRKDAEEPNRSEKGD